MSHLIKIYVDCKFCCFVSGSQRIKLHRLNGVLPADITISLTIRVFTVAFVCFEERQALHANRKDSD